jgi:UDP-glucose 4-epimerase
VQDLADAHVRALGAIRAGEHRAFNLGNGLGYSVAQVVAEARAVTGRDIATVRAARRAGDPPVLVADASKARRELGWRPERPALADIIASAWAWHRSHPRGYDV